MKHLMPILATAILLGPVSLASAQKKLPTPSDQAKAADAALQQMLRKFDRDGDGQLNPQEQAAADQALLQGFPMAGAPVGNDPYLKQFDRDGDGRLSPAEMRLARDYFERMRRKGGGPQRGFNPAGNNNGQQPAPSAADQKAEKEKEKVSPLVKRYDKDGDGKLNASEKAAAQAELKKDKKKDKEDAKPGK